MKKLKLLMALGTSVGMLSLSCGSYAEVFGECAPRVNLKILEQVPARQLSKLRELKELLTHDVHALQRSANDPVTGQIAYDKLLNDAQAAVAQLPADKSPALLIKFGDTPVVDTHMVAILDNLPCPSTGGNSYSCWIAGNVSPEARASVSTALALTHPCGRGIEENWSRLAGGYTGYLSLRLGNYLESDVTVTISEKVSPPRPRRG